jgi:acyl carrier protein
MKELIEKLKQQIIEELQLHDVIPDNFGADTILFGGGLGLDSIDSLQLVVLLDRQYGVKIKDPKEGRAVMQTVRTMANHILEHQNSKQPPLPN